MAYSLRYWYNNKLTDGKVIRLEIYKKDSTAAAMEIGDVVQGISLNIDGGEDNIDAPIVSTSLVMTFCDAYDHPEAEVKKCGNYAEFYTPDATLWKVVLLCKDNGSSSFRTLWGGYVTPDSYEEDLTYRGSVTIVARDNIGHMADFPFDAEGDSYGTISFREIIEGAWAKIESPMSLVFHDEWMQTEGVSALDTRMNVTAFEDKSWHEAVEAALYAYGAVLRFIGDNQVKVSPLRYMPNYGGSVTQSEPVFMTGATRMLTPAVKRIEETASYELVNYFDKPPTVDDLSGEVYNVNDGMIQTWPLANTSGTGWANPVPSLSPIFNPTAYELLDGFVNDEDREHIYDDMYILTSSNQNSLTYSKYIYAYNFEVELLLGRIIYVEKNNSQNKFYLASGINAKINYIKYGVSIEKNGIQQWLKEDGSWGAGQTEITLTKGDEESLGGLKVALNLPVDVSGVLLFTLHIFEIGSNIAFSGCVALKGVSFSCENTSLLQTNRVNTNFNEENNVIITRDPAIAPAYNTTFLPSVIKNGIFYAEGLAYKPAKAWAFAGDTPQQMAVYNHLQLLAYYAKPNNVIEGSIVNGDVSRFAHIWQFEGKEHILVSGRYNFINGYIEGAILREFARYENLWGSTGDTELPATETSNETNVESSARSSSAANTYENTTTVNIGGSGGGASNLKDLQDVKLNATASGDLLYFNGSTWINSNIHNIITSYLDLQKKLGDWFYLTEDGKSIGTRFNLFTEQEFSAKGLSLGEGGGGSSDGGLITSVLNTSYLGAALINSDDTVFNAYATNEIYKVTQANATRISILESQVGDLMVGGGSKVTVSNLLTTGTRVATITIDGTAYNIFAPVGEGGSIDTSAFLPIKGGTIQGGTNVTPFVINSNTASLSNPQSGMRFTVSGVSKGWIGYSRPNGCHFYNYANGYRLGIKDDGGVYFSPSDRVFKALLHSGNYTDYTVGKDGTGAHGTWKINITGSVGGHEAAAFFLRYTRQDGAMDLNTLHQGKSVFCEIRTGEVTTSNCPFTGYGALLSMRDYSGASQTGFAKMQIAANSTSAWIRAQQGGDVAISSAWNQLAFVTSNVASATKLETARTLWGQKFDGSANVTGNLRIGDGYLYLNNNKGMYAFDASGVATYVFGLDSSNTYLFAHGQYHSKVRGKTVTMTYGVSHTTGLILNASGNVTIGGSDLASTNYKLYVNGSSYVGGNIVASGEISANVLNQGSDIRFKDRIEDVVLSLDKITNAPIFRFRWNDRKDDRVYVGTSAQYWREHIAELVSVNGEGFHKLDYSTLGVIIGVTLGKVVKNHEERISEIERRLKHECK